MIWEKNYHSFNKRVWKTSKKALLVYVIGLTPFLFISAVSTLISMITGALLLLIRSYYLNRKYLKSLVLFEDQRFVLINIFKYNKSILEIKIDLDDFNVKIVENIYSFGPSYRLQIYKCNELIYKQYECLDWDRGTFVEIVRKINNIKGLKSYTSWVKSPLGL